MPLGSQVKTQKSPMHARDKHAWGMVDVLFCGLLCCLACGLHRQIEAQRKISGDKLFLLLLHHGTV